MEQEVSWKRENHKPNKKSAFGIILTYLLVIAIIAAVVFFLPNKSTKTTKQSTKISPTPTEKAYNYDVSKAKKMLAQYLKDTIKSEYLPKTIEIKQGIGKDGKKSIDDSAFGAFFTVDNTSTSANFVFNNNSNTISGYGVLMQLNKSQELTSLSANSLLSSHFKSPYVISKCKTKDVNKSYCEVFQTTSKGKVGYGAITITENKTATTFLFTCFAEKTSSDYAKLNSCIQQ